MKFYIDSEFNNLDLISLGCKCENGATFYIESNEFNAEQCSPWVKANVLPHLEGIGEPLMAIRFQFETFIQGECENWKVPEFWGDYCAFDYVLVSRMMGTMDDWPENWPFYFNDIRQEEHRLGLDIPEYPSRHHALGDAIEIQRAHEWLLNHR